MWVGPGLRFLSFGYLPMSAEPISPCPHKTPLGPRAPSREARSHAARGSPVTRNLQHPGGGSCGAEALLREGKRHREQVSTEPRAPAPEDPRGSPSTRLKTHLHGFGPYLPQGSESILGASARLPPARASAAPRPAWAPAATDPPRPAFHLPLHLYKPRPDPTPWHTSPASTLRPSVALATGCRCSIGRFRDMLL